MEMSSQPAIFRWLQARETAQIPSFSPLPCPLASVYKSIYPSTLYSSPYHNCPTESAVFNLDFSEDGTLLAAVGKDSRIILFDTRTALGTCSSVVHHAHTDCINGVKFYNRRDSNHIVTCSDDKTVKLWDLRSTSEPTEILRGHLSHVKNADYCDGYIVSCGIGTQIVAFDVNSPSTDSTRKPTVLLETEDIMRCIVSSDHRKLVVTTSEGYIIVIHNLHIPSLPTDLKGFDPDRPNLNLDLFAARETNRVSIITDFVPRDMNIGRIFSAQLHPTEDCLLTRYYADFLDRRREFTSVHDISIESLTPKQTEEKPVPAPLSPVSRPGSVGYYVEEDLHRPGIIKEVTFSHDGRVIASPYKNGVRLLSYNSECGPFSHPQGAERPPPTPLYPLTTMLSHGNATLTTKLSPTGLLLATACINGNIIFHTPKL